MSSVPKFEARRAEGATLKDIDTARVDWFVTQAARERDLSFRKSSVAGVLDALSLKDGPHLLNAALLLFGREPQRIAPAAVIKCVLHRGSHIDDDLLSHQVAGGTLFQQADEARDFVLTRLDHWVGERRTGLGAQSGAEIPATAIAEVIVNAIAHRDYDSTASVQVAVFSDRVEVINPGRLPRGLRLEDLPRPHASVPVNPFIAHVLFLARYIDKLGAGIPRVIASCRRVGLPEPTFEERGNQFSVTLWRDALAPVALRGLGLSERQLRGLEGLRRAGRLTNSSYQALAGVTRKTATRDLDDLVKRGVLVRVGEKRGAHYIVARGK